MSAVTAEQRIARARLAQRQWATLPIKQRIRTLAVLRDHIAAARDSIVDAIVADAGKPPLDALSAEVLVTLEQMLFYERRASRILRSRRVAKPAVLFRGCSFREQLEPYGVALIYSPANYPFQLAMVPAITALFAGNAVLLKVSERTPSVARIIESLCEGVLPAGLLQVLHDSPDRAGDYLDARPDIVFFTGSTANGASIAQRAAAQLIPTVLELGGKDAAIAFADCDLERTANGITYGAFSNAGQVCVGVKRLYVERTISRELLERLVASTSRLRIGTAADSDLGVLQPYARERFTAQVDDALSRGAKLETPGPATPDHPVILSDVPADARLLTEESFGPVLCVSAFDNEDEAIQLANSSAFALSASVWTNDLRRGERIAGQLNAGSCAVNDVIRNIANPYASFGGNGYSGYGRYHGADGLRTFSRSKSVMLLGASRRRELHWFPFTSKTFGQLSSWISLRHRTRVWTAALRRFLPLAILAVAGGTRTGAQPPHEADLRLEVQLPANAHGSLAYAVFSSANGFPRDKSKAVRHGFAALNGERTVVVDAGRLTSGSYAVSVYLDENGNHKLDTGIFGIPKEPVGASNNPQSRLGPPRYSDCVFRLGTTDLTIPITLVRP